LAIHCACAYGMSIRPIQVEVTNVAYSGQNDSEGKMSKRLIKKIMAFGRADSAERADRRDRE